MYFLGKSQNFLSINILSLGHIFTEMYNATKEQDIIIPTNLEVLDNECMIQSLFRYHHCICRQPVLFLDVDHKTIDNP